MNAYPAHCENDISLVIIITEHVKNIYYKYY
jgi:hypothetical protein